jgi:RNase P protein component
VRLLCHEGKGLIGIAVAKKLGSHPVRNKLKRRCREAIRACLGDFLLDRDYVLVVGLEASKAKQPVLASELKDVVTRINQRALPVRGELPASEPSKVLASPSSPKAEEIFKEEC